MGEDVKKYPEIKRNILRFEKGTRVVFFAFVFINIAIVANLTIIRNTEHCDNFKFFKISESDTSSCKFYSILKDVYTISLMVIALVTWISQIVIYRILVKSMKASLPVMYEKKKNDLKLILAVSLVCTSFFCLTRGIIYFVFTEKIPDTIDYAIGKHNVNGVEIYLVLIYLFLYKWPY